MELIWRNDIRQHRMIAQLFVGGLVIALSVSVHVGFVVIAIA